MNPSRKILHLLHEAIWVYLRPYWKLQMVLVATVVLTVLLEVCAPLTIKFLIDSALIPHNPENLATALLALGSIFLALAAARYGVAMMKAYMNAELYKDLYGALVRLMQKLPMRYFDQAQPGHFSPLFDTELLNLSRTLRDLVSTGLLSILKFVAIVVTLFILNWQLAVVVVALLPLMAWRPRRYLKPTVDALDQIRKVVERNNSAITDFVSTQTLARAFGRLQSTSNRLIADSGRKGGPSAPSRFVDLKRMLPTAHFRMLAFKLSMDNQQAIITMLVIGLGACLNFAGMLTLGTFSAFVLLLPDIMKSVGQLAEYVQELSRTTLSLDRFEAVERESSPAVLPGELMDLGVPARSIQFEQVSFSYRPDQPLLRAVNLSLSVGQSMALVGRSGSGKSTLFKLLLGFYSPGEGRVMIDGHDLRRITPMSLGSHFGAVLQQSILLNATLRANICFAKPDATDEEMMDAARQAEIHDYIVSLPNGYDTGAGEGGKWLSEGQKQRIALARALLPNPAILLLDEVTASLDPESESAINATIQRLAKQRTLILVTHRLASVAFVDTMVLIDQGQVQETGSHDALLERAGPYQKLWQMQSGFVVSGDGHHAQVLGERLQTIPLFRGVAIDLLNQLADKFVSEFYPVGQAVYEEGSPGEKFFIVVRGTVSVSTVDAAGTSIRLADLQDGDYFGEGETLSRGVRRNTVKATLPTLVLALRAEYFLSMMEEISSLNKIVTQMALGRSLSMICSVGRRRRKHPVWQELIRAGRT